MTARYFPAAVLVAVVGIGVAAGPAQCQGRAAAETTRIMGLLDEVIETKNFTNPMTLKDAIQRFWEECDKKDKVLPIVADSSAFREKNADATSVYDTQVQLPALPGQMTVGMALRLIVSQVPTNNATYVIRQGQIVITTFDHTTTEFLLKERVRAQFTKVALQDVLAELSALTGAPIVLDARIEKKGQEPVTVLLNNLSLEDALTVLTEQAGLKFVTLHTGFFVTTPADAKVIQEREDRKEKERGQKLDMGAPV